MAIYLYEVFLKGERQPRVVEAENLKRAKAEAVTRFDNVRHVRLAREWFNDSEVPEEPPMVEYFEKYPFGNMTTLWGKDK